jgi:hypothetical protein
MIVITTKLLVALTGLVSAVSATIALLVTIHH